MNSWFEFYLNSSFAEIETHGQFLASEDVRILGLLEGPFQLVQLEGRERRPRSAHFAAARLLGRRDGQIDLVQRTISQLENKNKNNRKKKLIKLISISAGL